MTAPVLFDIPGPKARARIRIGTVIGIVLILGLIAFVLIRLGRNGQLDPQRWAVLFDPRTRRSADARPSADEHAAGGRRRHGARHARSACCWRSGGSPTTAPSGGWSAPTSSSSAPSRCWSSSSRCTSCCPKYGIELTAYQALTGGLVLYNSAVLAEIFRAGILSIDKGQSEAAYGIGMRKSQVMTLILLPQATRRMLPVLIAQLVVLLKDSSLGFIIGYFELLRGARSLVEFFSVSFGNTYTFQLYVAAGADLHRDQRAALSAREVRREADPPEQEGGRRRDDRAARRRGDGRRRRRIPPA